MHTWIFKSYKRIGRHQIKKNRPFSCLTEYGSRSFRKNNSKNDVIASSNVKQIYSISVKQKTFICSQQI